MIAADGQNILASEMPFTLLHSAVDRSVGTPSREIVDELLAHIAKGNFNIISDFTIIAHDHRCLDDGECLRSGMRIGKTVGIARIANLHTVMRTLGRPN